MIKVKEEIERMEPYIPPLNFREKMLKLDFNENTLGPSEKVRNLINLDSSVLNTYPNYLGLKEKIAEYAKTKPENIVLTNGSDEGIDLAMRCFVNKGKEVIIPTPSYKLFYNYAQFSGAKIKKILYNPDLSFPTKEILRKITNKTKIVVICNPNSPTGTLTFLSDIKKIAKKSENLVILVDEAYFEFSGLSAVSLLKKFPNIITLRTFSKAFGLAGLRIGYMIANKEIAQQINKAKSPYSVNLIAVKSAFLALGDLGYVKSYAKEINKNKKLLGKFLEKRKVKYYKSSANFILVNFGLSKTFVKNKLLEKNILVRDVSSNPLLENCLRITIGTKKQMNFLMKDLNIILNSPLLVFDLDNTLFDINKSQKKSIKNTFSYFTGKKIPDFEIQKLKDTGNFNNDWFLTQKLLSNAGFFIQFKKIKSVFQKLYLGRNFKGYIQNEKPFISEKILDKLSKQYRLAILTGRPRKETVYIMKKFGLDRYFSKIICLEDTFPKLKPNPYGLNGLLKDFNAKKAYYVGDSAEDITCAKKAGIKPILYLRKNRNLMKIFRKVVKISDFKELFEVIK
ncbi:MAG: histidinol-phosphate transaminase [Candidatus Diapherotrites archaeon CG08_land_8_20_14_0_20_34_12]|nr:MAG: histidinol-phosphate transaminase [Candidatus Diapherotrites archaeon CG08_land_8_20_14_0_20_34_12]